MKEFSHVTTEEREDVLSKHITSDWKVDRESLSFETVEKDLPSTNMEQYFELPPALVGRKQLVGTLAFAPDNNKGRWMRTMIRTYLEGGIVLYRKLDENSFAVRLQFRT